MNDLTAALMVTHQYIQWMEQWVPAGAEFICEPSPNDNNNLSPLINYMLQYSQWLEQWVPAGEEFEFNDI